ncbi:MAG TPA: hypothetical protein VFF88_01720, partial [Methylocella sp.]|nr:hypothetical protein [Methylocella sp.]
MMDIVNRECFSTFARGVVRPFSRLNQLRRKIMDRREFIAAAGTVAAAVSAAPAFAQMGAEEPMHPPKYKALE